MLVRFPFWRWQVHLRLSVRPREAHTWDTLRERIDAGQVFVQVSHCHWCGRPTPHETCHAHSTELGFDPGQVSCICALWDSSQPPETCTDPACPVWADGAPEEEPA